MAEVLRVALVIPVYNHAAFVGDAIRSVLAQTYPAIDAVVVDDGSTDETPRVLAGFAGRIRVFHQPNRGQSASLNRLWGESDAPLLAYLSSDDVLAPDAIARMVAVLAEQPEAMCAYPDCDLIDRSGKVLARRVCKPFDLAALAIAQQCHIGPGAVFRADGYRAVGGWREDMRLAPDADFWLRLASRGPIVFVPEVLAQYRVHRVATSRRPVSQAGIEEVLGRVRDYFAGPFVPGQLRARQAEAFAMAHRGIARTMLKAGRIGAWLRHTREARRLWQAPAMETAWGNPIARARVRFAAAFR